ncbi:NUDIX domain-containing protein [Algiphilus sp.]|uniref:NUDIX domain-containing protein n=1 Tax=Algiphilus sp. TaxID=1872431 RepID=UPI003C7D4AC8
MTDNREGFLSDADFRHAIASLPLVSVDLLIVNGGKLLLGQRRDEPARGTWFVPGGRIRRGERIAKALQRVWCAEIVGEMPVMQPQLVGAYEHFYDCAFDGSAVATHYVVLAYRFEVEEVVELLTTSHRDQWWAPIDRCPSESGGHAVHPNAQAYCSALSRVA